MAMNLPPRASEMSVEEFKAYDRFRTGLTFADVRQMLWSYSEDNKDWKNVTRKTVLGYWRQIKLDMWERHKQMEENYEYE